MQFDDRLATVLRMQAGSERAARTQFRQLLDLVGSAPGGADEELLEEAYAQLGLLSRELAEEARARIVHEPGLRLRNPELISFLANQELTVATAALERAMLSEAQWEALIPALPVPVRGLVRHRKDLPEGTRALLNRLGLAHASIAGEGAGTAAAPPIEAGQPDGEARDIFDLDPALELAEDAGAGIGALVRRIEAFQKARRTATEALPDSPRLPLGEEALEQPRRRQAFDFATDAEGRINWADPALAPMTVGLNLASELDSAPARSDVTVVAAIRRRQPIRAGRTRLEGAPAIAGEWRIDAVPHFSSQGGRFAGFRGRMRRPAEAAPASPPQPDPAADRMRQMLHELRTPVSAIQGFAEVIQQQVFGHAPNEYRALAASIASDAARILAGFDELDRLARLESGALELDAGHADFRAIVAATTGQLDSALRSRSAGLRLDAPVFACPVAIARHEAELLCWRLLSALAGAASPGEVIQLGLTLTGNRLELAIDLPAALSDRDDIFEGPAPAQTQGLGTGMFGTGFALRLARAEARAAGGDLARDGDTLCLSLPSLEAQQAQTGGEPAIREARFSDTV